MYSRTVVLYLVTMKHPWIKPYLEILDDEKPAELPNAGCWRVVQLLLAAAETDEGASSRSLSLRTRHLTPGASALFVTPSFLARFLQKRTRCRHETRDQTHPSPISNLQVPGPPAIFRVQLPSSPLRAGYNHE